jgi:hypothetical protein
MEGINEIKLTEVLTLESSLKQQPWKFFVNPEGQLETFFHYKANVFECLKESIKLQLNNLTKEELSENFRKFILNCIKTGGHLILAAGKASNFDWKGFLANFDFIKQDFWIKENLMKRDYLIKSGLLTKNEDFGFFNDEGGFRPNEDFAVSFLCVCSAEEMKEIKPNMPNHIEVEFWLVTN